MPPRLIQPLSPSQRAASILSNRERNRSIRCLSNCIRSWSKLKWKWKNALNKPTFRITDLQLTRNHKSILQNLRNRKNILWQQLNSSLNYTSKVSTLLMLFKLLKYNSSLRILRVSIATLLRCLKIQRNTKVTSKCKSTRKTSRITLRAS